MFNNKKDPSTSYMMQLGMIIICVMKYYIHTVEILQFVIVPCFARVFYSIANEYIEKFVEKNPFFL